MGKSSKDKRDAYYRLAKEQGWRARSAFKLLQLDEEFNLLENVTRVVDLCAAPGSWSQVLSRVLIKGERFGRKAWVDKMERMKEYVLNSDDEDERAYLEEDDEEKAEEIAEKVREKQRVRDEKREEKRRLEEEGRKCRSREDVKIVAIDLQPMSPLQGINMLRADITDPRTIPQLLSALDPESAARDPESLKSSHPVDLILCDGAPDVTGLHDLDIYIQSQLLWAALNLALCVLRPGGTFVAKIFRGKDVDLLYSQLRLVFDSVTVAKPRSSRASSLEAFVVCRNFKLPDGLEPTLENPLGAGRKFQEDMKRERTKPSRRKIEDQITELELGSEGDSNEGDESEQRQIPYGKWIAPFLACGDLSAYDSDATYALPEGHVSLDPIQPPTAPPYKEAIEMRKAAGGAYGKTKNKNQEKE